MHYLPNSGYSKAPQHNSCICLLVGCRAEILLQPSHHLSSGTCGQIINIGSTYCHPLDRSSDGIEIDRSCRVIPNNSAGMHMGNPGCHCSYNHHICKVLQIWLWGFWCIQASHYSHKTLGRAGDCISTMAPAGGDTSHIGALGMQIGDWVGPI